MTGKVMSLMKEKLRGSIYPICTTLAIFIIWQMMIVVLKIPNYAVPGPVVIVKKFFSILDLLWYHTLITLVETLIGMALAVLFAVAISIALVWFRSLELTALPILEFIQGTPKLAIAPLFLVWFGFGYETKIIICFWAAYFPMTIATITGLKSIETNMVNLTRSMSATTLQTFIKVRIPNSLPHFFSGLKLAGFSGLLGSLVGEFIGASKGLGYLIVMAQHNSNVVLLFAIIVCTAILSKSIYSLTVWIERCTIPWHVIMRGRETQMFTE